jgi:hypothetical protein
MISFSGCRKGKTSTYMKMEYAWIACMIFNAGTVVFIILTVVAGALKNMVAPGENAANR